MFYLGPSEVDTGSPPLRGPLRYPDSLLSLVRVRQWEDRRGRRILKVQMSVESGESEVHSEC